MHCELCKRKTYSLKYWFGSMMCPACYEMQRSRPQTILVTDLQDWTNLLFWYSNLEPHEKSDQTLPTYHILTQFQCLKHWWWPFNNDLIDMWIHIVNKLNPFRGIIISALSWIYRAK